jgi:ubiquinone/menaquinone biosynthesis C-methylase UbiE
MAGNMDLDKGSSRGLCLLPNEVNLVQKLCARLEDKKAKIKVLDVGCGAGKLAIYLSEKLGCDSTGIDFSTSNIEKARRNSRDVKFEVQSGEEMDFANNTFDAVVSLKALHEIPNPMKALKESNRVLKEEGGIMIIDWIRGVAKSTSQAHAQKCFTTERLKEMLSETGFRNISVEIDEEGELMLVEGEKWRGG